MRLVALFVGLSAAVTILCALSVLLVLFVTAAKSFGYLVKLVAEDCQRKLVAIRQEFVRLATICVISVKAAAVRFGTFVYATAVRVRDSFRGSFGQFTDGVCYAAGSVLGRMAMLAIGRRFRMAI